jgi:hypothetical protein
MRLHARFRASEESLFLYDANLLPGLLNISYYMRFQVRFRASEERLFVCEFSASSAQHLALHKAPPSLGTDTQVHWAATIAFLAVATGP